MRFVLLGANGQLGRELARLLPGEVAALDRGRADLTRPETLHRALDELRADVVVNCAAYTHVDRAESEPDAAFAVNAWGVRELARWCGTRAALLVHFSTDHVFGLDAGRRRPYEEDDAPGPVGVYGLSKLAGEYLVRGLCRHYLVIRTCGLYGLHGTGGKGTNFVETMLRLAEQGRPIRVVADQVCTPTAAADLAAETVRLIRAGVTGLHHRTNSGCCNWHEFACAVFRLAELPVAPAAITSADYPCAARRPAYSVLESRLGPLRPWQEALAAYLQARRAEQPAHAA
jgi:dTDP-4-dehydrorhamnose reductase